MKRNNAWLATALAVGMVAYMLGSALPGRTKVNETAPGIAARASGVAVHTDVVQASATGPRVVDGEIAFAAVNANSDGFSGTDPLNEMQVKVQPTSPTVPFAGKQASARGGALELGLGSDVPTPPGDVLAETVAEQVAPPNKPIVVKDAGPLAINPLAYASLLHSEALANYTESPCLSIASSPIAYGRGYAADAQLLDSSGSTTSGRLVTPVIATDDPRPNRNVSQTVTYLYAAPNGTTTPAGLQRYGLVSETHETFAPVTILRESPSPALIIEVLGEWVFKTTATGIGTGSKVEYYVVDDVTKAPVTPTTDVIRFSSDGGATYTSLKFQDLFTDTGLIVPVPPLLSLAIGEDPRALAAPGVAPDPLSKPAIAADGTSVSGAVDVVRLDAVGGVQPGFRVAGLRIGHFESALSVPAGGFSCTAAATTSSSSSSSTSSSSSSSSTSSSSSSSSSSTSSSSSSSSTPTTVAPTTVKPTTTTSTPPRAATPLPIRIQPNTVG